MSKISEYNLKLKVEKLEKELIIEVFKITNNIEDAASLLCLSKQGLYNKIRRYELQSIIELQYPVCSVCGRIGKPIKLGT